ncbi:MAG: DNA mismatch repair protein MutS [Cyclobacteriaceae bacterium]
MNESVKSIFQARFTTFQQQARELESKYNELSVLRIVFFVITVIGLVYLANARLTSAFFGFLGLFLVGFPILVNRHQKVKQRHEHSQRLETINQEELQRLEYRLHGFDAGKQYLDAKHPYAGDLDVFGEHSLFQLINRSATQKGKEFLARWLLHPAAASEIGERQTAARELAEQIDWRQDQQAHGRRVDTSKEDIEKLIQWVSTPADLPQRRLYQIIQVGFATGTALAIGLSMAGFIPWYIPLLMVLVNIFVVGSKAKVAGETHQQTNQSVPTLTAYQHMMEGVEQQTFSAPKLQALQATLHHGEQRASQAVKELRFILSNFDARANMMYHIFNAIFLLDLYWLLRADAWKEKARDQIEIWLNSMGELEALNSLASFAFAHPDFRFPTIATTRHHIVATAMGHCLLPPAQRITNDFAMQGRGAINIITGSNMSGKSTFLRTVGTNVVLALVGAPVCARNFEVAVMQVFTSMRTQDSLEENVSSFYAELRRLRQLLTMLEHPELPVLFMLDEILKGTNSQDRHHGAASLIKQLSKLEASGFVSTHDLELGKLADELTNLRNYNFTSTIEGDEIIFDYQLHDGVCQSFNASKLMEKMGIAIEKKQDEPTE